jgi:hypothetical protein
MPGYGNRLFVVVEILIINFIFKKLLLNIKQYSENLMNSAIDLDKSLDNLVHSQKV